MQSRQNYAIVCEKYRKKLTWRSPSEKLFSESCQILDGFGKRRIDNCVNFWARIGRPYPNSSGAERVTTTANNGDNAKLIVCDLDQGLLSDFDAETELLEYWMAWEDASRPLLLFHSRLSLDELQRMLPATNLPPPNFLIGGGTSMLVRFTSWQQIHAEHGQQPGRWAGLNPEQMLAVVTSRALLELGSSDAGKTSGFPQLTHAALTTSGLSVSFGSSGMDRRHSSNAALSWILNHLKFDIGEIRTYASSLNLPSRVSRLHQKMMR